MSGGFAWNRTLSQGDATGKLRTYGVDATHLTIIAPGDVITVTGTADALGKQEADVSVVLTAVTGVCVSVDPVFIGEALSDTGLPALVGGSIKVNPDPHAQYSVDVENGPLAVTDVGLNADIVPNAATKVGGLTVSNMTLDATAPATTQTFQFNIVQLLEDAAGVLGNRAIVTINNTTLSDGAAGV